MKAIDVDFELQQDADDSEYLDVLTTAQDIAEDLGRNPHDGFVINKILSGDYSR